MSPNPAFGVDRDVHDDLSPYPSARGRERGKIDKTLNRHARKQKTAKKKVGDHDYASDMPDLELNSMQRSDAARRKAASDAPVVSIAGDNGHTKWGSGLAAVYDGDDWQEQAAEFVISSVFCCKRRAPRKQFSNLGAADALRASDQVDVYGRDHDTRL